MLPPGSRKWQLFWFGKVPSNVSYQNFLGKKNKTTTLTKKLDSFQDAVGLHCMHETPQLSSLNPLKMICKMEPRMEM
jgi:hypothetical protein